MIYVYILCRSESAVSSPSSKIIFNDVDMTSNLEEYNNLIGSLKGNVQFAQSHIIPSKPSNVTGKYWAHLVSLRDTLVIFKPLGIENIDDTAEVFLDILDETGKIIEWSKTNRKMMLPNELPRPPSMIPIDLPNSKIKGCKGHIEKTIDTVGAVLELKHDKEGTKIYSLLSNVEKGNGLMVEMEDGKWVKNIYLPQNNTQLDGKFITFSSKAYASSNIHYEAVGNILGISLGISVLKCANCYTRGTKCFENIKGQWVDYSKTEYSRIRYGNNFWSLRLPSDIIKPGIEMTFTFEGMSGTLHNIKIGAPNEILVNTIDIGLLTPYRNQFPFQQETKYQSQYFQQIPVSRLIVNQYEPITLEKMVLHDGTVYTMETGSTDEGKIGWHDGDIRDVGRRLITMGINNANNGIHSFNEADKSWKDMGATLHMTVNNMQGKYNMEGGSDVPKIVIHGGMGGFNVADVQWSTGNEFSHELGHTFGKPGGLPDYGKMDSTGLYGNNSLHRPANMPQSTWGWDSIKNVFLPNFEKTPTEKDVCWEWKTKWDHETNKPVFAKACQAPFKKQYAFGKDCMAGGIPHNPSTNAYTLQTPFTSYKMQEFFEWKAVFDDTSKTGMRQWVPECNCMKEWKSDLDKEDDDLSKDYPRIPRLQGVAVATLLGYYDPYGKKETFIYPALHGAYGNVFKESPEVTLESII